MKPRKVVDWLFKLREASEHLWQELGTWIRDWTDAGKKTVEIFLVVLLDFYPSKAGLFQTASEMAAEQQKEESASPSSDATVCLFLYLGHQTSSVHRCLRTRCRKEDTGEYSGRSYVAMSEVK